MRRDPEALTKTKFDLVVIGGGIQGAATAREAALRGLKVALVEARDFSSGTSSRSSKLIHGGLRYLEQFDFRLVGEARRERRLMLRLAPHLARPLPFLLPIYHGDPYYPLKIRVGLTIYDLLGNLGREDRHRMLGADEALRLVPALQRNGLRAAAMYYDSETDDARLTLENVLDAAEHGAVVANYAEVRSLAVANGAVTAAEVEDCLTGRRMEVAARFWVNAAGPWVDRVRALLNGFDGSKTLRLTKGTHLIIPSIAGQHALLGAILGEDRVFLTVPWADYTLLGTTDTDYQGDPAAVAPDASETGYLLRALNRVLSEPLAPDRVLGSFAGLRALVYEPGRSASAITREYRFHRDPWAKNFISICGGKLTTARALGEKLVNRVVSDLGARTAGAASSREVPLPGGDTGPFEVFVQTAAGEAAQAFGLQRPLAERIVRTYGSRWRRVLEPARTEKELAEPLPGKSELLKAEVAFAIREEMAVTVEDFFLRRSGLNWTACTPACAEAAPAVAEFFGQHFGWNSEQRAAAAEDFQRCACRGLWNSQSGFGVPR